MSIYTQGFIGYCCLLIIGLIGLEFYRQDRRELLDKALFIVFGLVAVGFVVLRPIGIVTDDYGYVPKFEALCPLTECGQVVQSSRDYVWYTLVAFGKSFSSSPRVMLVLSGVALTLKLLIVYVLSTQRALALLAYITIFYVINDVIAFRVSAAMAAYLFSIYCLALRWPLGSIASNILSGFIHVQGILAPLALIGAWLKPRTIWLNVLVLAPLALLGLGLYPKVEVLSNLTESQGFASEDGLGIWTKIASLAKGDRKPTRLVPLVIPPALVFAAYIYNYAIPKKHKVIDQAYFSIGLSALLLWFFGFNSVPQQRFFHFFFVPVILLVGNIKNSKYSYYAAIVLSAVFLLKYNVMHEMLFEYRKLYVVTAEGGKVTGVEYGISCGKDCYKFAAGTALWLKAVPDGSRNFILWEAGCSRHPNQAICRVVLLDDIRLKPIFKQPYQLRMVPSEFGRVWIDKGPIDCGDVCSAMLNPGVTSVLKAWPKSGHYLADWHGRCDESELTDCKFIADQSAVIQADFQPIAKRLLIVEPSATARIISDPPGIDCGESAQDCHGLFNKVSLKSELGPGQGFTGWTGCQPSNRLQCQPNPHVDSIVSLASKPLAEDELLYLGRDADRTGKDNKPDGMEDTHLQILHTFKGGDELLAVESAWASSTSDSEQQKGAWSNNRKSWKVQVLADGVPLWDDQTTQGKVLLHGTIRLDIYVPYSHPRFESKGSCYEIRIRIKDIGAGERIYSATTVVN